MLSHVMSVLSAKCEELEKNSLKVCMIDYSGHINKLEVSVRRNKKAFIHRLYTSPWLCLEDDNQESCEKWLQEVCSAIDLLRLQPDEPVEEMVTIQVPKSKAIEMGVA